METKNAFGCFVFVDFENVPEVDLGLIEGKPVHVTLLIGKNQKRFDLALVRQIHRLASQVELVEVGASGHNALDLTLSYYLGRTVQRVPGAEYCIVSNDKDFDPMIGHLQGDGLKVERCGNFLLLPFLPRPKSVAPAKPAVAVKRAPEDRRTKVITRLKNPANPHRPATQKALLRHIKAAMGKDTTDADAAEILSELCAANALTIDPKGRVGYAAG